MSDGFTVPGMSDKDAKQLVTTLQERLVSLLDLQLTLKHIHWNVVGPNFIAVHEMLDPQVDAVRDMADDIAERIATLGSAPLGTPGAIVDQRTWDDYSIHRAGTQEHLAALDLALTGVITDHRKAFTDFEDVDLVSQDMLIAQTEKLELFQWFVRAHLEDSGGTLAHQDARTEKGAAKKAS